MAVTEGEVCGTQYSRRIVSADQEAWTMKRLEEFAMLLRSIYLKQSQFPGASEPMMNGAIHGAIEGLSIELIRTLGCEPCFINIQKWIHEGLDPKLKNPKDTKKMSRVSDVP